MTTLIRTQDLHNGRTTYINPDKIEMIQQIAADTYHVYVGAEPLQWVVMTTTEVDALLQYVDVVNEAIAREPLTTLAD